MDLFTWLRLNSAAVLYALNAVLAMATSWGLHLSTDQAGAVIVIATAAITIITTMTTRPVDLQLTMGAVTAMLTAFAAFGLHLAPAQISTGVAVLSIILGGLLHLRHTPTAEWTKGTIGDATARAAARRAATGLAR
jgi:hypothetical protein